MHCLCFSTMSLHALAESALSSALDPKRRKQSSRAFFVSGQAQQLPSGCQERVSVLAWAGRSEDAAVGRAAQGGPPHTART